MVTPAPLHSLLAVWGAQRSENAASEQAASEKYLPEMPVGMPSE
jgi:hypothetical protein